MMRLFEAILSTNFIGINVYDIRIPFSDRKSAQFIQAPVMGTSESDRANKTVNHIFSQIPKGISVEYIILSFESDRDLSIAEYSELSTVVESSVTDDAEVFYNLRYVDRADFCWMGIIYAA
ncbi:hypothetical protein [Psychrobacter sp. 72-O-c]|uniref:hypothetical protein n=1 Tax=Psychrobacter sp. 72-O-c TaxID=2774125 RepID=UPI0019182F36|nr:hypothetical protein [Psychrobacter sp. 72-O-c]